MKFILLFAFLYATAAFGQLQEYNAQRYETDKKLMIGLGSWASLNIVGSGLAWATAQNEGMKNFHQMNVMWNVVNLGLAIPGFIKAKNGKKELTFFQTMEEQRKTETIFLINSGIDIAYMSAGLLLRSKASSALEKEDQFRGYGNSLLVQGGFLLLFDWIAYNIHRKHSKNELSPLIRSLDVSDNGLGIKFNLNVLSSKQPTLY